MRARRQDDVAGSHSIFIMSMTDTCGWMTATELPAFCSRGSSLKTRAGTYVMSHTRTNDTLIVNVPLCAASLPCTYGCPSANRRSQRLEMSTMGLGE